MCSAPCCVELVYRFGKYVLNNSLHEVAAAAAAVVAVAIKCAIYLCMHSHSALPKLQLFTRAHWPISTVFSFVLCERAHKCLSASVNASGRNKNVNANTRPVARMRIERQTTK